MDSPALQSSYVQDRCWSIPVIAACTTFLISVVHSSRGYLYVLYMDTYGISHGTASWPDSILVLTQNLSGFAITLLQNRLSLFSMTVLSASFCAGGIIVSAFAPNIVWTAVAVGGLYGTLFKTPESYALTLLYVVFDWSQSVLLTTAADYATDKGATLEKAKFVLTAIALGNLVGRTAIPWLADRISFSRAPFAVAGLVASFLSFVAASLSTSFESFAAFSAMLGVFQGYVDCIRTVIFAEYLGAFRDTLGSYDKLYPVLGALDLLGAVLLFLLVSRDRARRKTWEVNTVTDAKHG
ncbi:hypothetical protein MTO96_030851 [Rhipicephalus appendiculatus]